MEEKKWFVYVGDHHEGPYSVSDLQDRMAQGLVTTANYVWCDGMSDWQMMAEVPALLRTPPLPGGGRSASIQDSDSLPGLVMPALADSTPHPSFAHGPSAKTMSGSDSALGIPMLNEMPDQSIAPPVNEEPPGGSSEPAPVLDTPSPAYVTHSSPPSQSAPADTGGGVKLDRSNQPAPSATPVDEVSRVKIGRVPTKRKQKPEFDAMGRPVSRGKSGGPWMGRLVRLVVFAALLGGAGYVWQQGYVQTWMASPALKASAQTASEMAQPFLQKMADHLPVLRKWVSPLPRLSDVSSEDYEDLRAAASMLADSGSTRTGIAMVTTDPSAPVFYVAGNFADGTRLTVALEGDAETLLNATSMNVLLPVTVQKRLAKTASAKTPTGTLLPRGQYVVKVFEGDKPGLGAKPLATKAYFLGGAKDTMYSSRLREFHEALAKKASHELDDIKQFTATFEAQLDDTNHTFGGLKQGKVTPAKRKQWETFNVRWKGMWAQMTDSFEKWNESVPKGEYFYGSMYEQLQTTGKDVAEVHKFQDQYFGVKADRHALDIQIGQSTSQALSAIVALKAKVDKIEKTPPSANGMPQREGL